MNITRLYQEKNVEGVPEILSTNDLVSQEGILSLQGLIRVSTKEIQLDDEILNWLLNNGKIKIHLEIPEYLKGEDTLLINIVPTPKGNHFLGDIHPSVLDNYRECSVFGWMTKDNFTPSEMVKTSSKLCKVAKFFSNLFTNPLRFNVYDTYGEGKENPETKVFLDELKALRSLSDDLYINAISQSLSEAGNSQEQISGWVYRYKTAMSVFRGEVSFEDAKKLELEFKDNPLLLQKLTIQKQKNKKIDEIDSEFIQRLKDKDVYFIETEEGGRWHNWVNLEQEDKEYLLMGSNSSKVRVLPGMTRKV